MVNVLKRQIEIDCDSVLADIDGGYEPFVKHIVSDWSIEKYITDWNMPVLQKEYPEAYRIIEDLWRTPEFYANLKRLPKVEEAFIDLSKIVEADSDILVHTHMFIESIMEAKTKWLDDIRKDTGVNFRIEFTVGPEKKPKKDSLILIEDGVHNLYKSNADYKFLVRRPHNTRYTEKDMGISKLSFICDSFYDCVQEIGELGLYK